MDKKIEETREFLQTIGMPKAQQADICCYVILAMEGIKPDMSWSEATNECLYVGDTIEKNLVKNVEKLKELGFEITLHDKMPDVVLYREDKDWIYFVESVTSVGPMDPKCILEIEEMTKDVTAGKIFVTAFLEFKTYKKFAEELAWETEVWIAEMPEHMIHLNGD